MSAFRPWDLGIHHSRAALCEQLHSDYSLHIVISSDEF